MALGLNLRLPDSAGPGRVTVQNYLTPADNRFLETALYDYFVTVTLLPRCSAPCSPSPQARRALTVPGFGRRSATTYPRNTSL